MADATETKTEEKTAIGTQATETKTGAEETISKKYAEELRRENQKFREGFENSQKELAELKKFREDTEVDKLKSEKKFEELADKERKAREKAEHDAADRVSAYERRAVKAEVKALALAAGIEDPDDVELIDLSAIKFENDKIVGAEKVVEDFKKAKPHKFKSDQQQRGRGGLGTDNPGKGGNAGEVDARKMPQADFDALEQRLRSQR